MTESYDSLVVMFNLALAYQLRAAASIIGSTSRSVDDADAEDSEEQLHCNISQALSLYELCNAVMECENINTGPFFVMALTNNVGQCHSMISAPTTNNNNSIMSCKRKSHEKATRCFQHLLSIQMYLISGSENESSNNHNASNRSPGSSSQQLQHNYIDEGFVHNTSRFVVFERNNCSAQAA